MLKKKLAGFTLVEMIIALGVFIVMSLVLCMVVQMTSALTMDSQYITAKAGTHSYMAQVTNGYTALGEDTVSTNQTISLNGVNLDGVIVVELEDNGTYTGSPNSGYYEEAPNIRIFQGVLVP